MSELHQCVVSDIHLIFKTFLHTKEANEMVSNSEEQNNLETLLITDENELSLAIEETSESNKKCQASGYVVAGYFRLILTEPPAVLGQRFIQYEKETNRILVEARNTATRYLHGSANVTSLQRQILGLNTTIISECENQLIYLRVMINLQNSLSTNEAVEMINELIVEGQKGKQAASIVERELTTVEQDVIRQKMAMNTVAVNIGEGSEHLAKELSHLRNELKNYDTQIEILELQIAEVTEQIQTAVKVYVTARVVRRVIRSVIRGIAFIRTIRERNAELDALAILHQRRGSVIDQLIIKEEAMALVSGHSQNIESITHRSRQAIHQLANMGNAWSLQEAALTRIRTITIQQDAGPRLIMTGLKYAETAINETLRLARLITQQMTSIPFVQEPEMTVSEVYSSGRTTMPSNEWEYPDDNIAVKVQALTQKYNRERIAE